MLFSEVEYKEVYIEYFGYSKEDWIACEVCESEAVDIHHIQARGMGGSKHRDVIENLMALCRDCHEEYGDITDLRAALRKIHSLHMHKKSPQKKGG